MKKLLYFVALGTLLTACGGAKSVVKVRNNATETSTTISVSGVSGGSTSVTVSPDVDVNVDFAKLKSE